MFLAPVLVHLGEARLFADHPADATDLAERALTMARQHGQRGQEAWAQRLLGDIAARGDPSDAETAEDRYHDAMALAQELGMRPLAAHCQAGLAKVGLRRGRPAEAEDHWQAASGLYREMGMTYWLERAEGERRQMG